MPKKKRKRVALTEEERLLMMQQKQLAEEELNKKKEDMLAQFLKDKLAKEEHNCVLNMNKITLQWRTVLREVKARELRKDIEILSQTFERVVDCKDSVIKSLAKDLAEAEAQYAHALRSHLHSVDQLLQLQRCRLGYLEEDYHTELEALQKEFDTERKKIIEYHEQEIRYLQDVLLAMEQTFGESEYEGKLDFQSTRDDVKNKNLEEKHYLRMQLEGKVEELWKRFQQALRNYTEATEDRKIAFEALKLKDEKSTKEIEMQMKKLQKIQDLILSLKNKIAAHARESEEQNRLVHDKKEVVLKQLQKLKSEMNRARAKARSNLAKLTRESGATLKTLQHVVKKGELILRLAEMCRKLESEEEKVLPFYACSLDWEEQKTVDKVALEKPVEPLAQMMDDYVGLERFWQRYNKVRLEQLSLERTKAALAQDNEKLRQLLKQYLDGISVNDEVLSQINPLMIVNQHNTGPAVPPMVPVSDARVKKPIYNIVEAALEVKHIL
ncbi:dynein regulatory complex subunit 2 [Sphaerodactylus townsendi]|uniref:dynein regulatory complex subunit 2 n=1 Tax=Sphaerodactylus townsendi TaxID=933632 RepID=UPI0020274A45|nr:dynein regulatory complex subunit 2 [Sphaerodactylus townsendi]XP_048347442.1 dynein regulatory complex subunit 2 [Sphaerodactylus townsendi]XP_048347443.1 dynein regulatory complex subunit 2 [Sphaerodactylus townsendi]XP_048347444.1 dynein regulatory complex subunit 2 [Sphaerodactylus townsendi]XP_048347445.1 dynein regulatory complex subunit 2 [Sphaerodactylus townsendi]